MKTIHSFSQFASNSYFTNSTALVLFSIAGIPPFIGFFSKLLILITLVTSYFFFFFLFFFTLLFFGLYFYLQNLRFLYSTVTLTIAYNYLFTVKYNTLFFLLLNTFLSFICFGFLIFDEVFLYFNWLLV
jgi:NADH:ubiquinone oxidoreductase subunit 2 (subunit N)